MLAAFSLNASIYRNIFGEILFLSSQDFDLNLKGKIFGIEGLGGKCIHFAF
jgi:hypothetical protein